MCPGLGGWVGWLFSHVWERKSWGKEEVWVLVWVWSLLSAWSCWMKLLRMHLRQIRLSCLLFEESHDVLFFFLVFHFIFLFSCIVLYHHTDADRIAKECFCVFPAWTLL